jgi:hypothetical protein
LPPVPAFALPPLTGAPLSSSGSSPQAAAKSGIAAATESKKIFERCIFR